MFFSGHDLYEWGWRLFAGRLRSRRRFQACVPGQQFFDSVDRMVSDAFQYVPQVGLWIESIKLGRADQAVDICRTISSRIRPEEKIVATAYGDPAKALSAAELSSSMRPSSQ